MSGTDDELRTRVELALATVKGVRRDSGIAVQQLAQLRDSLPATTQEGTSDNEHTRAS